MRKRLLALCCILAVLVGIALCSQSANAATDRYQVGYAIRDINPWVDPRDHSKGMLPVELTGNGNDHERACTGIMDDNDDGVIGDGDGIFATTTVITDPYGKTMIYITIDTLQGYSPLTRDVRNTIPAALGKEVVSADQIMVNANHSHSAPSFSGLKNSSEPGFKEYYQRTVQQITDAAVEAYNDRAEAIMTKGQIDAKESTAHLGYNNGEGYHMNAIRHYNVVSQHKSLSFLTKEHVMGSNFGGMTTTMSNYNMTSMTHALESDNTMYILLFEFPDNTEKEPIALVNWRAHSTSNSSSSGPHKTHVSGDYATSLRTNMKRKGYRCAFLQGAGGNVVIRGTHEMDWSKECNNEQNTNVYGRILADVALDCIDRKMTRELPAGKIRNLQMPYQGQKQEDSEGLLAAANAYQEACAALGENKYAKVPYSYKHTDGKTYIINSKFHANAIITRSKANDSYTALELNAIIMGDNVAFVTAPNEMADRYDLAGSTRNEDNDWYELINEATYGMPFVLGYTNDGRGYIPFSLEYTYNTDEYYQITGRGRNGSEFHGAGSYEANTSRFARGAGEALVQTFKKMLTTMDSVCYQAPCQACGETVEWKPIYGTATIGLSMGTGHFYLYGDMPKSDIGSNRFSIKDGEKLCLDLKGHKMETQSRSFYMEGSGAVLNLMDSVGGGQVISYSGGNNVSGGAMMVDSGTTFNMYGGTLQFIRQDLPEGKYETGIGAVMTCAGTANIYGGTIIGGELVKSYYYSPSTTTNGCGAACYVTGKLNAYGGTIKAGKAAEGSWGDCVYLASTSARITLAGNAVVDEIYINDNSGKQLIVNGNFSGKVGVRFNPEKDTIKLTTDVGDAADARFTEANIYCTSHPKYVLMPSEGNLVAELRQDASAVAVISTPEGNRTYKSLTMALQGYSEGSLTLLQDTMESVSVNRDIYLDLNGCDITGQVKVDSGKTLYCYDNETDDFKVSDGVYGKISRYTGNVMGVPVESDHTQDGYLMVTQQEGVSFHRVDLRLSSMTLRAEDAGVYFKSNFAADEVVAELVDRYGVSMSVREVPNAGNIETAVCGNSWFTDFDGGQNASSTLLSGVLKLTNSDAINLENAQIPVHGRTYIRFKDGGYLFGEPASRSFQEQVELVSRSWSDTNSTQKKSAIGMYRTYPQIVSTWDVSKITAGLADDAKLSLSNGRTLRILAITDREGADTIASLYDIAVAHGATTTVIGSLYIEDATLETHIAMGRSYAKDYTYTYVDGGQWKTRKNVSLQYGVGAENWDIILIQQGKELVAAGDSYGDGIAQLTRRINGWKKNPGARLVWNMTWAEGRGAAAQLSAYQEIAGVAQETVLPAVQITKLIPTGTGIQNVRGSSITDALTVNGYLTDLGKIVAGYTLYGALLRDSKSLTELKLEHSLLTEEYKEIILKAVNDALDNPFTVTQ